MMNEKPRVLHLIDSLALGGAERIAVNMVNALNEIGVEANLAVSRKEGPLLNAVLQKNSRYIFLRKKHRLDIVAFFSLLRYVDCHKINIIHAHSTSLSWGLLVSIFKPVKVIWHNHYGNSEFLSDRKKTLLRQLVKRCSYVIAVNRKLETWAIEQLHCSAQKVGYLPNFPDLHLIEMQEKVSFNDVPVIVCVANLREPKDHHILIKALAKIKKQGFSFKVMLIGKDTNDLYSKRIKMLIANNNLDKEVRILGSQPNVGVWLRRADIGVLSSSSEGLPVALLEYGLAGLPVVCTAVGECPSVLGNGRYGILVPPKDPEKFAAALGNLLQSSELRRKLGISFHMRVQQHFSKRAIVGNLVRLYERVLGKGNEG